MNRLAGKRFWLVGASAGIGRCLALRLAREGVAVVASARNGAALAGLLNEIAPVHTTLGGHAAVPFDVCDSAQALEVFSRVGRIDGVIYCAGAYEPMSAHSPDLDALETMVDVNLTGALRTLAVCVPAFLKQGSGHIVLLGSLSGYRGLPSAWGYGATKSALIHLAENLRCDVRKYGIKVQVCNPGFIATRLTEKNSFRMPFLMTPEAAAERIARGMVRGRFEIAFPCAMKVPFRILAAVPRPLYFALLALVTGKGGKPS